jgi:outer membrane receptor protein involved in Fe transport
VTTKTRHDNAYAYLNLRTAYRASWTLGLAYDTLDNDVVDEDRSSPKLGVIWQLASATTLRAAWFRSLKRPVVGNQTVEPTQVAGFNQFFDDPNGSRTERYGVAIEQSFSPVVYVGAEATWRDINIPTLVQPANVTTYEDVDERAHRAYLYWAPTTNATLSAEYFLERFQRARGQPSDVETHRLPLGATYHLVSGFMGQLRASRVHQDVTSGGATEQDRFWTIDASFGYRLPRRRGIVSIGVQNLLDEQFNYYDVDLSGQPRVPLLQPSRSVFSRFTLSF